MERKLKLNCLVLDNNPNIKQTFSIRIPIVDNIEDLRERIKDKKPNTFQHIDADTLELWSVSISIEDLSNACLHDLISQRESLHSLKKLDDLFPDTPPDGHVHIIVQPPRIAAPPDSQPLLVLNCLVLGKSSDHIFPVKIAATESVGLLKEAIKEKKTRVFSLVDADDLLLWKVSELVDENLENNLKQANFPSQKQLSPVDELSKIFPELPVKARLHIVVGQPAEEAENETDNEERMDVDSGNEERMDVDSGNEEGTEEEMPAVLVPKLDLFGRASRKHGPGDDAEERCAPAEYDPKALVKAYKTSNKRVAMAKGKFRGETFEIETQKCVMIVDDAMEPIGRFNPREIKNQAFVAIVLGIKSTNQFGVLLRVEYFTRIHDLERPEHRFPKASFDQLNKVSGKWELFVNIRARTVIRLADVIACRSKHPPVIDFGLSQEQAWIGFNEFFVRGKVVYPKSGQKHENTKIIYEGNGDKRYNPSKSSQMLCPTCVEWIDFHELGNHPPKRAKKEEVKLKDRAKTLPVIRGGGWSKHYPDLWRKVKKAYGFDVASAWFLVGTYKLACGEYRSKKHKAAAKFVDYLVKERGFVCPACDQLL